MQAKQKETISLKDAMATKQAAMETLEHNASHFKTLYRSVAKQLEKLRSESVHEKEQLVEKNQNLKRKLADTQRKLDDLREDNKTNTMVVTRLVLLAQALVGCIDGFVANGKPKAEEAWPDDYLCRIAVFEELRNFAGEAGKGAASTKKGEVPAQRARSPLPSPRTRASPSGAPSQGRANPFSPRITARHPSWGPAVHPSTL
mmetsp:Transcript_82989/g.248623  ORF Transcript_82989/g.248623 Transcript_82989/m.248623 type:complete len:202 (+) Transcript_82989:200-805(+)